MIRIVYCKLWDYFFMHFYTLCMNILGHIFIFKYLKYYIKVSIAIIQQVGHFSCTCRVWSYENQQEVIPECYPGQYWMWAKNNNKIYSKDYNLLTMYQTESYNYKYEMISIKTLSDSDFDNHN